MSSIGQSQTGVRNVRDRSQNISLGVYTVISPTVSIFLLNISSHTFTSTYHGGQVENLSEVVCNSAAHASPSVHRLILCSLSHVRPPFCTLAKPLELRGLGSGKLRSYLEWKGEHRTNILYSNDAWSNLPFRPSANISNKFLAQF